MNKVDFFCFFCLLNLTPWLSLFFEKLTLAFELIGVVFDICLVEVPKFPCFGQPSRSPLALGNAAY